MQAFADPTERRRLRPWAAHRTGLAAHIRASAVQQAEATWTEDAAEVEALLQLPFSTYVRSERIFSAAVPPVVDTIDAQTDFATLVAQLLAQMDTTPRHDPIVQLYQLLIDTRHYRGQVWQQLSEELLDGTIPPEPAHALFLWWLQESPDVEIVDTALFVLARIDRPVPKELLMTLGRHPRLATGVAVALSQRHAPATSELIALARLHGGTVQTRVLDWVRGTPTPADRAWLLTEGYDNGQDYEPSAYHAIVAGGLIDLLRQSRLSGAELFHAARAIACVCRHVGDQPFFGRWWTMTDYHDGPEAVARLLDHADRAGLPEHLWSSLVDLLYFLRHDAFDAAADGTVVWTVERAQLLAARLRGQLERHRVPAERIWWEQPAPDVDTLRSGDLSALHAVLQAAGTPAQLDAVLAWVVSFLALDEAQEPREQRRAELLAQPMPGICTGGIAIATEQDLASVYGQAILQPLQRARDLFTPAIWPIVRTALASDIAFHRATAAALLGGWPEDILPADAAGCAREALAQAGDDEAVRAALRGFMS